MSDSKAAAAAGQHECLWQDREVRFDCEPAPLRCRRGESILETIDPIEDTKGNMGEQGKFFITQLRVVWQSKRRPRLNVTIGYRCVENISSKASDSRFIEGMTETLLIVARHGGVRYEFMFANLVGGPVRRFVTAIALHKLYLDTRLYRDLKTKLPTLMINYEIQLLSGEKIKERIVNVENLNPRENLDGTVYLTNYRFLWLANLDQRFNATIPYIQIHSAEVRQTQYGWTMVIKLSSKSGGHNLGFKAADNLAYVVQAVQRYHSEFNAHPFLGVRYLPEKVDRRRSVYDVCESVQPLEDVLRPVTCTALASDITDQPAVAAFPAGNATAPPRLTYNTAGAPPTGRANTRSQQAANKSAA